MERSLSHDSRSRCPELPAGDSSIRLSVSSTTGSLFELSVPLEETVQGLKRKLSERLRVPGERLLLLHRDERLNSGKLQDLGVVDGSRLTLMPAVEAGLMSQSGRSEQSVLQALESLTDAQVDDFLSGRSPLTLALRVCDHLMFVQLQLAAPGTSRGPGGPEHTQRTETPRSLQHLREVCETRQAPPTYHTHRCQSQASAAHTSHAHQSCQSPAPAPPTTQSHHTHSCQSSASVTPTSHSHYVHSCQNPAPSSPTSQSHHAHSCQSPALPHIQAERSTQRCKPGAVIESLVSRAPGVFSGTFSGTLHPQCQDSSGRPRRDVHTILQILNDLLSATRHYSPAATLTPRPPAAPCPPAATPSSPAATPSSPAATPSSLAAPLAPGSPVAPGSPAASLTPGPPATPCSPAATPSSPPATPSSPPATPTSERAQQRRPSGECVRQMEERAMRCRVQQVRLLLHQRRVRRRLRRHTRGPYQHSGALQMLELQTDLTA